MTFTCSKHQRYACTETECRTDNAGTLSMDTDGDLNIGIGNGLTIDPTDGSLGVQIAPGISIDF